ncbi:MAG: hypothetical protein AB2L11_12195 [Syntrophobacteraceae bacterium]
MNITPGIELRVTGCGLRNFSIPRKLIENSPAPEVIASQDPDWKPLDLIAQLR